MSLKSFALQDSPECPRIMIIIRSHFGSRWTSYLHRGLSQGGHLIWSNEPVVGALCTKRTLSFMPHSWCYAVEVRGCRSSRKADQWKREGCAHQAAVQWCSSGDTNINGENSGNVSQLHAQIAAVSKALAELEPSGDRELMQPLEARLAEFESQAA